MLTRTFEYTAKMIIDGIVIGFLKYIFCIVAAVIIHDDKYTSETFRDSIGIGISLQCSSTLITCLYTSYASEVKINISGPEPPPYLGNVFAWGFLGVMPLVCLDIFPNCAAGGKRGGHPIKFVFTSVETGLSVVCEKICQVSNYILVHGCE